jgi:hypothetical protein
MILKLHLMILALRKGTFNDRFVLRYTDKTLGITDLETTLGNQLLVSNKTNSYRLLHLPDNR